MALKQPLKKANKGSFTKDKPGPGRPVGVQNNLTRTVKETFLSVFNDIQDDPKINLRAFAKEYPRDFYPLAARLIPTEINAKINKVLLEIVRTTTTQPKHTPPTPAEGD